MVEFVAVLLWCAIALALVGAVLRFRRARHHARGRSHLDSRGAPIEIRHLSARRRVHPADIVGLVLLAIPYHGVLAPGISLYGDWVYLGPRRVLTGFFTNPSLWSSANLGSSSFIGLPQYPLWGLESLLARAGMSVANAQRALFLIPIPLLSYLGVVLLARRLRFSPWAGAIGGLIYVGNTFFLDWYSGGWLTILLGYALLPWLVLAALAVYRTCASGLPISRVLVSGAVLGLLAGLITWCDPRQPIEVLIAGVVSTALLLVAGALRRTAVVRSVAALSVAVVVAVSINLTWVLPAALGSARGLPATYTGASALSEFSYMHASNAVGVFDLWWPQMQYFVRSSATPLLAMVIPALVLLAVLRATRLYAGVAAAIYLVFSALVTGATFPLATLNLWLFQRVPGLSSFRYPALYEEPVVLAVAILVPPVLEDAWLALRNFWRGQSPRGSIALRFQGLVGVVCALLLLPYLGSASWPAVTGELGHMLAPRRSSTGASVVQQYLVDRASPGTIVWSPVVPQTAYQDLVTSSGAAYPNVSAVALTQEAMPGAMYQPGTLWWLGSTRVTSYLVQNFRIRYVVVAPQHYWSAQDGVARSTAIRTLSQLGGSAAVTLRRAPGYRIYQVNPIPNLQVLAPSSPTPALSLRVLAAGYASSFTTGQNAASVTLEVDKGLLQEVLSFPGSPSGGEVYPVRVPSLAGIVVSWGGRSLFVGVQSLERGIRLEQPPSVGLDTGVTAPVVRLVPVPPGPSAGWSRWSGCASPDYVTPSAERQRLPLESGTSSAAGLAVLQAQVTHGDSAKQVGVNFEVASSPSHSFLMPGRPEGNSGSALSALILSNTYTIRPLPSLFGRPLPNSCKYRARLLVLGGVIKSAGRASMHTGWALSASSRTPGSDLGPWQSLGNGDDYTHSASLAGAGISASLSRRPSGLRNMCLRARVDAATVSAPWLDRSLNSAVDVRLRYWATPGALITLSVFSPGAVAPAVTVYFSPSGRSTASYQSTVVFLPQTSTPVGLYNVVMSAVAPPSGYQTARSGCTAIVSLLSLVPTLTVQRAPVSQSVNFQVLSRSADEITLRLPPSKEPQLIAFWQNYDPSWRLSGPSGSSVRPIRLDRWANGFVISAHDTAEVVQLGYSATTAMRWGLYLSYAFLLTTLLVLMAATLRRLRGA